MKFVINGEEVSINSPSASMTFEGTLPSVTLQADSWDDNSEQTVAVLGVLADESKQLVIPSPASNHQDAFYAAGIRIVSQSTDAVTFRCKVVPEEDLTVYVAVMEPKKSGSETSEEVYSTEETRIGTWINGKPLYQKVVTGETGGINLHTFGKIIPNLDTLVQMQGCCKATGGSAADNWFPILYNDSNGWILFHVTSDGDLVIYVKHANYSNSPFHLTIKYTKTTD